MATDKCAICSEAMSVHDTLCIFCGHVKAKDTVPCVSCHALVPLRALYCPSCKCAQQEGLLSVALSNELTKCALDLVRVRAVAAAFEYKSLRLGENPMQHTSERTATVIIMCTRELKKSPDRAYVRAVLSFCTASKLGDFWTRFQLTSRTLRIHTTPSTTQMLSRSCV